MARPRGVEQVAGQHRIEAEPRERDAVSRQQDQVELQVVADLAEGLVLEQRLQALEGGGRRQLGR